MSSPSDPPRCHHDHGHADGCASDILDSRGRPRQEPDGPSPPVLIQVVGSPAERINEVAQDRGYDTIVRARVASTATMVVVP
jgi:hypothetical protein